MGKFMPSWTGGGFRSPTFSSLFSLLSQHSLADGRLSPPAWPSPAHHWWLSHRQPDTDGRVQVENTDPEKNQTCRCSFLWSTPANESIQRLLQCRYNQDSIYFHFHRTINLIYTAPTTNKFCLGYKQTRLQHAQPTAYTICVHPLVLCAHVILLIDVYSCAHTRARSALELNSYI